MTEAGEASGMTDGLVGRVVRALPDLQLVPGMGYDEASSILGIGERATARREMVVSLMQSRLRARYIRGFGFGVVTGEELCVLEVLMRGRRAIEAGSGSGYLSRLLSDRGVSIRACDNGAWGAYGAGWDAPYQRDHSCSAVGLIDESVDVVLMSWPPIHDPLAFDVSQRMVPGQVLVHLGEDAGGCTGSASFFKSLGDRQRWRRMEEEEDDLNRWHLRFDGIKDHWSVFQVLA